MPISISAHVYVETRGQYCVSSLVIHGSMLGNTTDGFSPPEACTAPVSYTHLTLPTTTRV